MRIDVITIFPEIFDSIFNIGVIGKARERGELQFHFHNLRNYTHDKHKTVDDIPFGGGGGLVFKIEPLIEALRAIRLPTVKSHSILLSPRGKLFSHDLAETLSAYEQLILFCGRYEGVDERFSEYVDAEVSIGNYVLSGGEIPAMVMMDVVSRFIPGVIGQEEAPHQDSFSDGNLEHPVYTRPRDYEGKKVPDVLFSGHHQKILEWRKREALNSTLQRRPDLLEKTELFKGVGSLYGKKSIKISQILNKFEAKQKTKKVPALKVGDTVKVHAKIKEGDKERIQVFEGIVTRLTEGGQRRSITVRKMSFGVGVERTFPVYAPTVDHIDRLSAGKVRRARLYYLRDKVGKAARIESELMEQVVTSIRSEGNKDDEDDKKLAQAEVVNGISA